MERQRCFAALLAACFSGRPRTSCNPRRCRNSDAISRASTERSNSSPSPGGRKPNLVRRSAVAAIFTSVGRCGAAA